MFDHVMHLCLDTRDRCERLMSDNEMCNNILLNINISYFHFSSIEME